jgi:hypothetical protein
MGGARGTGRRRATLAEIREIVGDLEAAKLEAILAAGATPGQIEQAMAWAAGASDLVGGELPRPVAAVYQILASELPPLEERD